MFKRAFIAALAIATVATALSPASAQERKRVVRKADGTYVSIRDEDGRRRTRIIIQRRSFLDGGTQVLPGERKFSDYATQPAMGRSAVAPALRNTSSNWESQILPGPFDLPSNRNPMQW